MVTFGTDIVCSFSVASMECEIGFNTGMVDCNCNYIRGSRIGRDSNKHMCF